MVRGRAWITKAKHYEEKSRCIFSTLSGKKVLIGPILVSTEESWCVLVRPGAAVPCIDMLDLGMDTSNAAVVIRHKKQKLVLDSHLVV